MPDIGSTAASVLMDVMNFSLVVSLLHFFENFVVKRVRIWAVDAKSSGEMDTGLSLQKVDCLTCSLSSSIVVLDGRLINSPQIARLTGSIAFKSEATHSNRRH